MTDQPITLDRHRGMAAQKATEIRRLLAEVEANEQSLRARQEELETHLIAVPAATWPEAAEKARYLLGLFAATSIAQDPRRKMLIANVLEDFARLSQAPSPSQPKTDDAHMKESINEIQRLLHEIAAHLVADTKMDARKAIAKLERIAALASTSALTIQVRR